MVSLPRQERDRQALGASDVHGMPRSRDGPSCLSLAGDAAYDMHYHVELRLHHHVMMSAHVGSFVGKGVVAYKRLRLACERWADTDECLSFHSRCVASASAAKW